MWASEESSVQQRPWSGTYGVRGPWEVGPVWWGQLEKSVCGLTIQSWAVAVLLEIEQDGLHGETEGTDSGGAGNVKIPSI